jgi:hypothetical protein
MDEAPVRRACTQPIPLGTTVYATIFAGASGGINARRQGSVTKVLGNSMYEVTLVTGEVFEISRGLLSLAHPNEPANKRPRHSDGGSSTGGCSGSDRTGSGAGGGGSGGGSNNGGGGHGALLPSTITSSITVNSHEARHEINAMMAQLPYTAATSQYTARLWHPATNTLGLFAALLDEILDSGILSTAEQTRRVELLRALFAQQPAQLAAGNGLPNVVINITISSGAARQGLAQMLSQAVYTAAIGQFLMRLWDPLTNTLQQLLAVMADVIASGVLPQQQTARVSLHHTLLSNVTVAAAQQQQL